MDEKSQPPSYEESEAYGRGGTSNTPPFSPSHSSSASPVGSPSMGHVAPAITAYHQEPSVRNPISPADFQILLQRVSQLPAPTTLAPTAFSAAALLSQSDVHADLMRVAANFSLPVSHVTALLSKAPEAYSAEIVSCVCPALPSMTVDQLVVILKKAKGDDRLHMLQYVSNCIRYVELTDVDILKLGALMPSRYRATVYTSVLRAVAERRAPNLPPLMVSFVILDQMLQSTDRSVRIDMLRTMENAIERPLPLEHFFAVARHILRPATFATDLTSLLVFQGGSPFSSFLQWLDILRLCEDSLGGGQRTLACSALLSAQQGSPSIEDLLQVMPHIALTDRPALLNTVLQRWPTRMPYDDIGEKFIAQLPPRTPQRLIIIQVIAPYLATMSIEQVTEQLDSVLPTQREAALITLAPHIDTLISSDAAALLRSFPETYSHRMNAFNALAPRCGSLEADDLAAMMSLFSSREHKRAVAMALIGRVSDMENADSVVQLLNSSDRRALQALIPHSS